MSLAKLWGRGQLTIPSSLRKELHLEDETTLNIVKAGNSIILTPRRLAGDALAHRVRNEMEKEGLSLEDLLKDLEQQRDRYNSEQYGI